MMICMALGRSLHLLESQFCHLKTQKWERFLTLGLAQTLSRNISHCYNLKEKMMWFTVAAPLATVLTRGLSALPTAGSAATPPQHLAIQGNATSHPSFPSRGLGLSICNVKELGL